MTREELIGEIGDLSHRAEAGGHLAAAGTLAALASCLASGSEQALFEAAMEVSEAGLEDVNFVQALAEIAGMALELSRLYRGLKDSIEILKAKRDPRTISSRKWTPHEGVPRSVGTVRPISQELPD